MASILQGFVDGLTMWLTVLEATTYVSFASLTILAYEWAFNLSLEVSLVWKSRPSLIKYLYLITRYLAFGDVTVLAYVLVANNVSAQECAAVFSAFGWMFTAGFLFAELLLLMRAWAVWGRDFRLAGALLAFYVGMVIPICVNMSLFLKSIQLLNGIPGVPSCVVVGSSRRLFINWVLLLVLDIGVLLLMIVKGCKSYVSGGNSQLMKVVYGEGILYYFYLVVLSTTNVILILKLPYVYWALLMSPMRSIHAILTCRVVLHTRQQAEISTIVLGQTPVGAASTFGPTETLRFVGTGNEVEEVVL